MSSQSAPKSALAPGSLVLITGISGLIGAHVANQALAAGYKVRGTTRDVKRNAWLQELYDKRYGAGKLELVEMKDMTSEAAFEEVMKG
jgi:nucleoside-diphosphate-sugar epimerase